MAGEYENRSTHTIHETGQIGSVEIADEVVAIIAGLAAVEVEGVACMVGSSTDELVEKLGKKNLSRGVKVTVMDTSVSVDLSLQLKYGTSVSKVAKAVQERVKNAIENMTGMKVVDVNIRIAGVDFGES